MHTESHAPAFERLRLVGALTLGLLLALWLGMTTVGAEKSATRYAPSHHDHSTQSLAAPNGIAAHGVLLFEANLSPAQEVPAVESLASGRAVLALVGESAPYTLTYRVSVADITGIGAAHIHKAPAGANGGVIFTLFNGTGTFNPNTPISGEQTLTEAQANDLKAGTYYVNVHTAAHGGGEIRGQVRSLTPPTHFSAPLLGRYEVPPVTSTNAAGIAKFTLVTTDTLDYRVDVADIISITAAHIHKGAMGVNGGVRFPLYGGSGAFGPGNPLTGTVMLAGQDWVDLLTGFFYVNVHTLAHGGGEIRGQIGGTQLFDACICGAREVPPVNTNATGYGVLALDANAATLAYRVDVDNLRAATAAHIHKAPAGSNGGVIFPIFSSGGGAVLDEARPLSGTLTLTPTQVIDLIAGRYYINIHTSAHGGGEMRGQVHSLTPETHMMAPLAARFEVPAVNSPAVGIARFTLNPLVDKLHYSVVITEVSNVSAAHIHKGAMGVNGGVIFPIFSNSGGGTFGPGAPIGNALHLNAQNWVDLLTGQYYVNIHTSAHGGGELRGQVGGPRAFASQLSGLNEVPPITTTLASGVGVLTLNDQATSLNYWVGVDNISNISMAHIHKAAAGTNGGVIFTLFNGTGTFDPASPISGTLALSNAQLMDLIGEKYYINVHTSAHGSGEIRGQIEDATPPTDFMSALSGTNEVPPVMTNAFGHAHFSLDPLMGGLRYTVSVSNTQNATAAHIHRGIAGKNGGVVFPLFSSSEGAVLDAANPLGGCLWLDDLQLLHLLTEQYYVNIHTTTHGGGEIRGQVMEELSTYLPAISKE